MRTMTNTQIKSVAIADATPTELTKAVRDVGFPIVACLILLYALVWRMPEAFERATQRIVDVLKEAREDQRGILMEIRIAIQRLDDRSRTTPK